MTVATQSDEFLHLPLDELNSIILEDELNVKSEEVVWEAVLRWVHYDPDLRWQHTVKLMGSIRLGLLDTQVRTPTIVHDKRSYCSIDPIHVIVYLVFPRKCQRSSICHW